jgi:hypothetical protein
MKLKLFIMCLMFANLGYGADLTIVNKTKELARVEKLGNKCQNNQVPEGKPIFLEPNASHTFKNLAPVVQTYTICGSGFCSQSAMGMKKGTKSYTLEIIIKDDWIDGNAVPDHWSTTNLKCPK